MKKLLLITLLLILFQSCFSYNTINQKNLPYQILRKIEVKKLDKIRIKGRLIFVQKTAVIIENNGLTQRIPKKEIYDVKVRNFSQLKTAIIGLIIVTGLILIIPPFPPLL